MSTVVPPNRYESTTSLSTLYNVKGNSLSVESTRTGRYYKGQNPNNNNSTSGRRR